MSDNSQVEEEEKGAREWFRTFRNRVNVDRILVIILTIAVVVVGWTSVQNSNNYHNFTKCTVTYLVKDKTSRDATTAASRKLVTANNKAFKTIPDFFKPLVASASPKVPPTPAQQKANTKKLLKLASRINSKFETSNDRYHDYRVAIKNNPTPPDPNQFCKKDK